MGVKGLQTFVEACPAVFRWVDLAQMAADYRKIHGEIPVIVVDGRNCVRIWIERVDWVCGGQWDEYLEILRDLMAAFEKIGVKLVFFFGGHPPLNVRELWLYRCDEAIKKSKQVFAEIKASVPLSMDNMVIPAGLIRAIIVALKFVLQATVYCNVNEDYHRTIASYAVKNKCLAILAQDSAYIIYPTVPYVSMKHLDFNTMRTRIYCRDALCRELGINLQLLPLFAYLVGTNHVIRTEFHNRICANRFLRGQSRIQTTVRCVAGYLAKYVDVSQEDMHAHVAEIYTSLEIQHVSLADFRKRLEVYTLDFSGCSDYIYPSGSKERKPQEEERIYDVLLEKVKNEDHLAMILNVLFTGRLVCYPSLEDFNADDKLPPCVLLYRPLRQRMYCLLFELKDNYIEKGMFLPHTGTLLPTSNAVEEWWINPSEIEDEVKDIIFPEALSLPGDRSNATVMHDIIMGKSESSEMWSS